MRASNQRVFLMTISWVALCALVFLKLTHRIDWSWWIVLIPAYWWIVALYGYAVYLKVKSKLRKK